MKAFFHIEALFVITKGKKKPSDIFNEGEWQTNCGKPTPCNATQQLKNKQTIDVHKNLASSQGICSEGKKPIPQII